MVAVTACNRFNFLGEGVKAVGTVPEFLLNNAVTKM